jgi:hypothetical protein
MTRRDSTGDDTGEQDVRELRRLYGGDEYAPKSEPYVRDKEDVPHEHAIPDFYGLEEGVPSLQEVKDELSELVDAGELCMGWDEEEQSFVYWFPEGSDLVQQPAPAPEKPSRRTRKPRRRRNVYRRSLLILAASVAPFFFGMTAEAALDMHAEHKLPMDQPDMAGDEVPLPAASAQDAAPVVHTYRHYVPATPARHAKATTSPNVEKPDSYVGKHRKTLPKPVATAQKKPKKPESKAPKPAATATPKPTAAPSVPSAQKPDTPAEAVVNTLLRPVAGLLG